jgi:hypothetical protein
MGSESISIAFRRIGGNCAIKLCLYAALFLANVSLMPLSIASVYVEAYFYQVWHLFDLLVSLRRKNIEILATMAVVYCI